MTDKNLTTSGRPIEEIEAADAFRNTMISRADGNVFGHAPMWYGWVIIEAFLAGIDYARQTGSATPPVSGGQS